MGLKLSQPDEHAATHGLDQLIWTIVAAVAAAVLIAHTISDFRLAWSSFVMPAGTCAALLAGSWFYRARRVDPRLASALGCTAQIIAFGAVGAPLSYLAASFGLPLQDQAFDALDKVLGFDWLGLFDFVTASPRLSTVLRIAYVSFTIQASLIVLALAFFRQLLWLRVFVLSFILTALVTIAVAAVLPGVGAWELHGMPSSPDSTIPIAQSSLPVFHALRDGTLRQLTAIGAEGIITFPSLHAALGLILMVALWPIAGLRWIGIVLNAVMIAATPIDGMHYLVDVIAGLLIALACVATARALAARIAMRTPKWSAIVPSAAPTR
ncbi:MAG: phosphatase PAP2 family protein [Hyphomicrobiales bacterium]|nr:phosphatase PAP2 family protein [Hyphomicrobiales bacterium]